MREVGEVSSTGEELRKILESEEGLGSRGPKVSPLGQERVIRWGERERGEKGSRG